MSLLYSLPAVASDSLLTVWSNWMTIVGTVFGLPLTMYAVHYAKKAFKKQNEALELQKKDSNEQKILGAWSLLAQKGTGDLGRKDALEFLHKQGKSLNGVDLTGAYLFGLKLVGADLTRCNFAGATLRKARFDGAILIKARFNNAQLDLAHFEGANLLDARFEDANLIKAHFDGADLLLANFEDAVLWHAHFEGAILAGARFDNADLGYAHLECANLWDAKFYDADLGDAHFEGVKWVETVTFKDCYVSQYSKELPTAPECYEFLPETNEDGTRRTKIVDEVECYYIKLTQLPNKKPLTTTNEELYINL